MDKLEHYLDVVCRGVAGPRSLRQHIRQELREHLLDAAAQYESNGLTHEQAVDRALEDFGGPEEVRSELAQTHGQRVMAVVIDKAMQWKEATMKSKWLWMSWAHVMLLLVIAAATAGIGAAMVFVVPKFREFGQEGWLAIDRPGGSELGAWSSSILNFVIAAIQNWAWWLIPLAVLWLLFEWRARSEHKPYIRLTMLGVAALGLVIVLGLVSAALSLPFFAAMPMMIERAPEPMVNDKLAAVESSVHALEQAATKQDWHRMSDEARAAANQMGQLARLGSAAPTIASADQTPRVHQVRSQLRLAQDALMAARHAAANQDAGGFESALQQFHDAFDPLRAATSVSTTRPATAPAGQR